MANEIKLLIHSLDEIPQVSDVIIKHIKSGTLFLFDGEMSAGKTTLIADILKRLGVNMANSPTYAIHQTYSSKNLQINHIDLHRLESSDEIESTGFWDLLANENEVFFIEWAQKIAEQDWPQNFNTVKIHIKKNTDDSRMVTINFKA